MTKFLASFLPFMALLLLAAPLAPAAQAAAPPSEGWVGRTIDDRTIFLTAIHLGGNEWSIRRNSSEVGKYVAVSTGDYLELQEKGGSRRIRIYADTMQISTRIS